MGDLVTVENEYGISVKARITEVVEVYDDNGYSIEPKFEYLEEDEPTPSVVSGYILTENASKMLTENSRYLVREEAVIPEVAALNDSSTDTENIKISELPEIELLQDGCCMPVVSNGETTKMYYSTLKQKLQEEMPQTQISIGQTITGEAGTDASVTNSGTATAPVFDFVIPRGNTGAQGPQGEQGIQGDKGADGEGVPTGGTTGQVLTKSSDSDYDTEWADPTSGTKEVVLYDNPTGSSGTITLSDSSANYTYLEIFYRNNDNIYSSLKVYQPNGKQITMMSNWASGANGMYLKGDRGTISGKTITINSSTQVFLGGSVNVAGGNYHFITRVVGYK